MMSPVLTSYIDPYWEVIAYVLGQMIKREIVCPYIVKKFFVADVKYMEIFSIALINIKKGELKDCDLCHRPKGWRSL